ncbi:MAG: hypothetical protein MZW92_03490 [Comamonadaceae bacterium]|nr:hypothetical protein [Comamonadaceae bacterium]
MAFHKERLAGAVQGRGPPGHLPDGDRRHLRHQQGQAHREAANEDRQKPCSRPASSAFYFDDQRAIKSGAPHDGARLRRRARDPGLPGRPRSPARRLSVLLHPRGRAARPWATAPPSSTPGPGGRDPLFLAADYLPLLERHIRPLLEGAEIGRFRDHGRRASRPSSSTAGALHTAIRYGLSQALLDARALATAGSWPRSSARSTACPSSPSACPSSARAATTATINADKMIMKQVDVLPHALINNVETKLGQRRRAAPRIHRLAGRRVSARSGPTRPTCPSLHIDVYGTIGVICALEPGRRRRLPGLARARGRRVPALHRGPRRRRRRRPARSSSWRPSAASSGPRARRVKIVADEWCNTYEDVVDFTDAKCLRHGPDQDARPRRHPEHRRGRPLLHAPTAWRPTRAAPATRPRSRPSACVHAAVAARAERLLAKPGMGFDEGFMIVRNEMERVLAVLRPAHGKEA